MSVPARIAAAIVAVTAVVVAPLPALAETSRGVTIPSFYDPPSSLPSADGSLVRTEPLPLALSLPGINSSLPGRATRIMYKSTDSNGQPVAVTGAYLEPAAAWPGSGPRPLVVLAPGTMGQGDQCSTSLALQQGLVVGATQDQTTISIGYEVLAMDRLLAKGIAVVETDYVGLGTTDRLHTYVNRVDEGHAVLDAARAAKALPGTSITSASAVGLYGYSQGGGAIASAAELEPSYAPDVKVTASYVGAPPADLNAVMTAIDGSELVGALGWSINGFVQSDPALQPVLDKYLSTSGKAVLNNLSTMCVGDAIFAYADQHSTSWTSTGQSVAQIVKAEPTLQAFINSQLIGTKKPVGVLRVASGVFDNLVPHAQARTMAVNWCKLGGNVVYAPIAEVWTVSPLVNHFAPLLSDQGTAVDWLGDRLAGKSATSTCSVIGLQP